MEGYYEPFKGKKITVMGLGLLGRGVGDVEFLAKCGAQVLVTDKKTPEELAASIEKLKAYQNIEFHLAEHTVNDFINADLVIKGAKVPLDSPYIAAAKDAGVPVAMSTALFAKYAKEEGATIIGVTGTRGKTTIASMIHHTLVSAKKKTILGGNIRGISTLAMLPKIESGQIVVLELDSWQLQGFGDMKMSPHIAVFTNLYPDHLDYYPDMASYFQDKANIFKYQKKGDVLIVGDQIADKVLTASPPITPVKPSHEKHRKLKVIGEHNHENAALAAAALRAAGLSDNEIKRGLESFEPIEGRLQFVREVNGVKIYNDNNATTPEATIAAIEALTAHYGFTKPVHSNGIILIAGGSDKGLDMAELLQKIQNKCKDVILLSGTGTGGITDTLSNAHVFDSLQAALRAAMKKAKKGDIILFSPAFASFGMFKNEYERNDQFLKLICAL